MSRLDRRGSRRDKVLMYSHWDGALGGRDDGDCCHFATSSSCCVKISVSSHIPNPLGVGLLVNVVDTLSCVQIVESRLDGAPAGRDPRNCWRVGEAWRGKWKGEK